jgi:hypothetical protein
MFIFSQFVIVPVDKDVEEKRFIQRVMKSVHLYIVMQLGIARDKYKVVCVQAYDASFTITPALRAVVQENSLNMFQGEDVVNDHETFSATSTLYRTKTGKRQATEAQGPAPAEWINPMKRTAAPRRTEVPKPVVPASVTTERKGGKGGGRLDFMRNW